MILLDTSGLLAALFVDQRRHAECARVFTEAEGPLVLSSFVLAELDYLVAKLAGEAVERELLAEVARGAYRLAEVDARDVEEARVVIERHGGLGVGLADAMTVVLSRRLGCLDVLTLDERHFRVLRGFKDRPFRVLPADP
ncbi:MAG TPA: PIN domain-containing protein [Candidatus Sulfomarinibacteraceae bacterium]|nr:PIN domain-containing protein [Candidatus Sulfomarinibacteraceae bacterium]